MKLKLFLIIFVALILCFCASPVRVKVYSGAPSFSPTNPATVSIIRQTPRRPHVQLGEIRVRPKGMSRNQVNNILRNRASELGAHAVVIVVDNVFRRSVVRGRFWRHVRVYKERIIVGVAIRFRK